MAQFIKRFVQDLTQDIKIRQCGTIVFNKDNESNVITVDLYNGQEEYSGGGSVAGACICPDGSTVPLTGSISGKTASVTLTGDCFAFPGQIGIGIQVVSGTTKTTVLKAIYNVELFETDDMVDPGSRITASVGQLVADIEAATAEIPASDMASLMSGIAPQFNTTTNYAAGAYVYYSGTLYRFTNAHAAGSWTGTDATAVALGNDVSDIRGALNDQRQTYNWLPQINYYSQVQKGNPCTINGRTYSIQPNGEILVTGVTATAGSTYYISSTAQLDGWDGFVLPAGTYRFYTKEDISSYANIGVRFAGNSSWQFYFSRNGNIQTIETDTAVTIGIEIKSSRVLPETGLLVQPMIVRTDADYGYIAPWASLANYVPAIMPFASDTGPKAVNALTTAVNFEENGVNWWATNDPIFYNRSINKQNALKHIRDVSIVTTNDNDVFTVSDVELDSSGNYEVHVIANGTDVYSFSVPASDTPVRQTVNRLNRTVSVLCDTNGLTYPEKYVSTTEAINVNARCVTVLDTTLSKARSIPDSKSVGDKFADMARMDVYQTVKYDWSFWGTAGNPTGWVAGTFDRSTGASNSQQYYMRTLQTVDIIHSIPGAKKFTVTAPEGYAIQVCEYDVNDDSFIKSYGLNDIREANATRSITINVEHGRNYKFALGRFANNDSESYINDTFVNSIELLVYTNYDIDDIYEYYFPYLDNVVDKINEKANDIGEDSFRFLFITDHHYLRNAYQSPKLIHYILKKTGIHTVIFGGDAFQNWKDRNEQNRYVNMVYSAFESCGESDYYCVTGNHEWNDTEDEYNTQAGINAMTTDRQRNKVSVMDKYGNYFVDDVVSKTRIFFLSTTIQATLPWTSILWLGNSLNDVPDGYNVMVIVHAGLLRDENGVIYQKNTYMNVSKLLGAFDRSEQVDLYDTANTLQGSFDYTNKNGTAICYLCGHCHADFHITKEDNDQHVLVISTTGDLYKNASGVHYTFVDENGETITRNVGTIYEQAFDVIQIDPTAKKVYCTRVGAGLDREFSY